MAAVRAHGFKSIDFPFLLLQIVDAEHAKVVLATLGIEHVIKVPETNWTVKLVKLNFLRILWLEVFPVQILKFETSHKLDVCDSFYGFIRLVNVRS